MGLNSWTRNKVLIAGRLFFGGGYPRFGVRPRVVTWGANTSVYWLGTELVWVRKR